MTVRLYKLVALVVFFNCLAFNQALSDSNFNSLTVSLAQLPVHAESTESGTLVNLVKAIDRVMGTKSVILVEPFPRSIDNVKSGKADYHLPELKSDHYGIDELGIKLSSETIFKVPFVIYYHNSVSDIKALLNSNQIYTLATHSKYFGFEVSSASCLECSLKKVNAARLKAFVFAMWESDKIVKENKLNNIKRHLFNTFDVRAIINDDENYVKIDRYLTTAIRRLKESGKWGDIMGVLLQEYKENPLN